MPRAVLSIQKEWITGLYCFFGKPDFARRCPHPNTQMLKNTLRGRDLIFNVNVLSNGVDVLRLLNASSTRLVK